MHIKLENIGIIKESTIALDGLTVITGKNNSGKSTVGKALYALLDAVCDLQDKAKKDRLYYIRTKGIVVFNSPYKKVYLADDPFILDDISKHEEPWTVYNMKTS